MKITLTPEQVDHFTNRPGDRVYTNRAWIKPDGEIVTTVWHTSHYSPPGPVDEYSEGFDQGWVRFYALPNEELGASCPGRCTPEQYMAMRAIMTLVEPSSVYIIRQRHDDDWGGWTADGSRTASLANGDNLLTALGFAAM